MSIKESTFQLAKKIWDFDFIDDYRELVYSLNHTKEKDINIKERKANFGYAARHQYAQAWGYLLVNIKREDINSQDLLIIPRIDDSEIKLIEKVHMFISELNRIIINKYFINTPNVRESLLIYDHKENEFKFSIDKYYDNSIYDDLINQLSNTDSLSNIINSSEIIKNKIPKDEMKSFVEEMERRILKAGILKTPSDFEDLRFKNRRTKEEIELSKLLFSILVFKKQLAIINQLLYQAFLSNRLALFDNNNVYEISQYTSHLIGTGIEVYVQPNDKDLFVEPGEISLLDIEYCHKIKELVFIESKTTHINKNFGSSEVYSFRLLNDDLNPYHGLLQFI